MENVTLKRDYRGLKKGTEFVYDANLDCWIFEQSEEEIADNSRKNSRVKVRFSDSFVRGATEVFDVPGLTEKLIAEKEQKIKDLQSLVDKTLEEIEKLKKEE